jgi:hypothetical protein
MNKRFSIWVLLLLGLTFLGRAAEGTLDKGFARPPDSAKPHTMWMWMNGNVTKEGITADLEAMKQVGLGGAVVFNLDKMMIPGTALFLSDEWRQLTKHAADESKRLGLELVLHNCAGWSSSGGPWNTPENSMQMLVTREASVTGPGPVQMVLPKPFTRLDWYRDIAVVAVPAFGKLLKDCKPKVFSSVPGIDPGMLLDGDFETGVAFPASEPGKPNYVQFDFAEPFTARSFTVLYARSGQRFAGEIQASQDGLNFETVRTFAVAFFDKQFPVPFGIGFDAVTAKSYRVVFAENGKRSAAMNIREVDLSPDPRLEDWAAKSGYIKTKADGAPLADSGNHQIAPGDAAPRKSIIDLTSRMKPDGTLSWDAPPGNWRVLRFGHTSKGSKNWPAALGGHGLECDKLSATALDAHWDGMMKTVLADAGGKTGGIRGSHIDSYEMDLQNWTTSLPQEFSKRRGYELGPFLPALTGRVVENAEVTERFLWDFRKTLAELFAENYYGRFAEQCHKNGILFHVEPYPGDTADELAGGLYADVPMTEFWFGWSQQKKSDRLTPSSVVHTGGKTILGAEAFTADSKGWLDHPYALKAIGDLQFCAGVNRMVFHRYAMQPWKSDVVPGMTMGPNGIHFDRTTTWWDMAPAWISYLTRCQFLLQQGLFVADVAVFTGEKMPDYLKKGSVPEGYDFDLLHPTILSRMTVQNGRITLPHGMSYRVLKLPDDAQPMTLETARKIKALVAQGAVVSGPKPLMTPSLVGYPNSEEELQKITTELWGNCDGKTIFENRFGKGRVFWGKPLADVLTAVDCSPDFSSNIAPNIVNFIHRKDGDADIYFVASHSDKPLTADCSFRITGKQPEFFHPDTGKIEPCPVWRETDGRTVVPVKFDPAGSVFVIFRKPAGKVHLVDVDVAGDLKILNAWYGHPTDESRRLDITEKLQGEVRNNTITRALGAGTLGSDPAGGVHKKSVVEYEYNGVKETVELAEGGILALPQGPAPFSASETASGFQLKASAPGAYRVTSSSGKTATVEIEAVPAPVLLDGPWDVRFQAKRGAPEQATFEKLMSLPDHADPGIKYFSGTATYRTTFDWKPEGGNQKQKMILDLGDVQVIAQVALNGKKLGVLWKKPYQVDVTDDIKPGKNELTVEVANLWVNRLIGDEQFPEDANFRPKGQGVNEWPKWLSDISNRPEPRRVTFTPWKFYTKDSPLVPSGLVGPVRIITAEVRAMDNL